MRHTVLALLSLVVLAAPAWAAGTPPSVHTAPATGIGPLSATLNGDVNANGRATNVYFQYGTTRKYGHHTPIQGVGAGTSPVPVAATVSGLRSSTTYHFRLVAISSAGRRTGGDRTFKTARPTTTPSFSPNPVVFGRPFTIFGQLVGTGAGNARVTLLGRAFPFTSPFAQIGNALISRPDGTYAFTFGAAGISSQFEIKANTNPPITTAPVMIPVTSRVSMYVHSRVRRGGRVRFSGTVYPAQNGLLVKIQRRSRKGNFYTFAETNLRHRNKLSSRYLKRLRLKRGGTFRALVVSAGGAIYPGVSRARSVRLTPG